jgi:hypothetical protein
LERFLAATGVEVAGIEFITDTAGRTLVYDVNTNTNYNPDAEVRAGRTGACAPVPERSRSSSAPSCAAFAQPHSATAPGLFPVGSAVAWIGPLGL